MRAPSRVAQIVDLSRRRAAELGQVMPYCLLSDPLF